jgi:hypothetical protein
MVAGGRSSAQTPGHRSKKSLHPGGMPEDFKAGGGSSHRRVRAPLAHPSGCRLAFDLVSGGLRGAPTSGYRLPSLRDGSLRPFGMSKLQGLADESARRGKRRRVTALPISGAWGKSIGGASGHHRSSMIRWLPPVACRIGLSGTGFAFVGVLSWLRERAAGSIWFSGSTKAAPGFRPRYSAGGLRREAERPAAFRCRVPKSAVVAALCRRSLKRHRRDVNGRRWGRADCVSCNCVLPVFL